MASSGFTSPTGLEHNAATAATLTRARSHSISSDQPSSNGYGAMLSPPALVQPQPLFIAISAAAQIVTNDHDSHSEAWYDQHGLEPSGETALVNPPALRLVNNFLDQLLFNFLAISKSTSLASLRPAVVETLKPKLAKEAIHQADQELEEYLGGGDDEELISFHNGIEPSGDWDLELVWKRTRLRCMVYSSLGDMEEEDEDHYTELEHLDGPPGSTNRYSNQLGVVSPAVAIFLTSILEFMGEQALIVAGQAAYHRMRSKQQKDERDGGAVPKTVADRVTVEDVDVEKVALDRTLGRLWRAWKKRIRPTESISRSMSRSFSRDSMHSRPHSRRNSEAPEHQVPEIDGRFQELANQERDATAEEEVPAINEAAIPLPMGEDDVREIEIPGVAAEQSGDEDDEPEEPKESRRKSMMIFTANTKGFLPTPNSSPPSSPVKSRKRSYSMPSIAAAAFASPLKKRKSVEEEEQAVEDKDDDEVEAREVPQVDEAGEVLASEEPVNALGIVSHSRNVSQGSQTHVEGKAVAHSRNVSQSSHKGGLLAGAAAGAAAVVAAGIAAVTHRDHKAESEAAKEADSDSEAEEAQIMTSARVSIIGDVLSLDTKVAQSANSSGRSSLRSKRSASVHSVRLVDVTSPRSPASRHPSAEFPAMPTSAKSNESGSAPVSPNDVAPRDPSPVQKTSRSRSPTVRASSPLIRQVKRNSTGSIPEVIQPEMLDSANIPRSVPVPDRSPLRDSPRNKVAVPAPAQSPQDTQFAITPPATYAQDFILGTAPRPKSIPRDSEAVQVSTTPTSLLPSYPNQMHSPGSGTSSAPPLTPLREMMENAPDTSDEASSIAPSYSDASILQADLPAGSYSGPTRPRVASVARSSPPRPQREDEFAPKPEFLNKSARQGSSSSSIKSYKVRPVRTSEESAITIEDKGQTFEQLIRSETTLQYTLTPSNMRGIDNIPESPLLPRTGSFGPRGTPLGSPKVAGFFQNAASSPKVSTFFGKEAADIPKSPIGARLSPNPEVIDLSKSAPKSGARVRPNAPVAREARVVNESIGDFADFIRSTGPTKGRDDFGVLPPPQKNVSANRISAPSVPIVVNKPPSSSANRNRLQARAAVVHGDTASSSELIDFIRQGPPSMKGQQGPRIPRAVAPFRTTMDSDQMSTSVSSNRLSTLPEDRDPHMTNFNADASSQSVSTANSNAALHNKKLSKAAPPQPPQQLYLGFDDNEDRMPKRKTRRVKDPYAIDFSDEEDDDDNSDELTLPKGPPKRVEESLIDFLNSVPPPPDTTAMTSIFDPAPAPQKKNLMARFSRSNSVTSSNSTSTTSSARLTTTRAPPPRNSSLPQKKHIPITPTYSTTPPPRPRSNYAAQVTLQRKPGSRAGQKPAPREAGTKMGHARGPSNDLADFLRNTGPPPGSMAVEQQQQQQGREEGGGFARMFGRRKKVAV